MASSPLIPRADQRVVVAACLSFLSLAAGLAGASTSDRSECNADFAGWMGCSGSIKRQLRNNIRCPDLFEARPCTPPGAKCGEFGPWNPPTENCADFQLQRRARKNCAELEEVRMCISTLKTTFKHWGEWGECTRGLQTRHRKCSNIMETKECQGTEGDHMESQCGAWTAWYPPMENGNCKQDTIYRRHRQKCPELELVKACDQSACTKCSANGYCDGLTHTCHCNEDYEGDGMTCTPRDPCRNNNCGPHATCMPDGSNARCVCDAGFTGKEGVAGTVNDPCVDLDECATGSHQCPAHSDCRNTVGDYTCVCRRGFVKRGGAQQSGFVQLIADLQEGESSAVLDMGPGGNTAARSSGESRFGVCEDVNECAEEGGAALCGGSSGICVNTEGSFKCSCLEGFRLQGSGRECVDIDECAEGNGCSSNAKCVNTEGGFACMCPNGYSGTGSIDDVCRKIDFCNEKKDDCAGPEGHSRCVNEEVGFRCECEDGYKGSGKTDAPCVDIDECDKNSPRHDCDNNASCSNTDGSFTCECEAGFTGSGKGPESCTDIDECATGEHNCAQEAICTNTKGSFICGCPAQGYRGDGTTCTDINECQENENACHQSAICTNEPGTFTCECLPGFRGDGRSCVDIDECAEGTHRCGSHSRCVNTPGNYTCTCDAGYTFPAGALEQLAASQRSEPAAGAGRKGALQPELSQFLQQAALVETSVQAADKLHCTDINECETKKEELPENSVCTNTDGSYEWDCRAGYEKKGDFCQKINYCSLDECSPQASCREINEGTDFECTCVEGYKGNGRGAGGCVDKNECEEDQVCAPKESGGICTNTVGSYACSCETGYLQKSNKKCEEIDECALMSDNLEETIRTAEATIIRPCGRNSTCTNTKGSYECKCKAGYTGDGFTCNDVDECADGTHTCGARSQCVNTAGAYTCVCDEGFIPSDGVPAPEGRAPGPFSCKDLDECATGKHDCSPHAACTNTEGSYQCTCNPGFEGSGKECLNIEFCTLGRNDCHADADCDENAAGTDYYCTCRKGFKGSGHTSSGAVDGCMDVDECAEAQGKGIYLCAHPGGLCSNTEGSFKCSCTAGFMEISKVDGAVGCNDVDECADDSENDCTSKAEGGLCHNTVGTYSCSCAAGFTASNDGKTCTDIDECKDKSACSEHATCVNAKGGYTCECDAGYKLREGSKRICEDVDECQNKTAVLPPNSICVNTAGGYDFSCGAGYERVTRSAAPSRSALTPSTSAAAGRNEGEGHTCKKIDYCGRSECHPRASCAENAQGTDFTCTCPKGFSTHNDGKGAQGCQDIDECAARICSSYGDEGVLCHNTEGSYECSCKEGYALQQPHEQVQAKEDEIRRRGLQAGQRNITPHYPLSVVEESGGVASGNSVFVQLLQQLAALEGDTQARCVDVDECLDSSSNACAKEGGKCTNVPGSYTCSCIPGYEQHGNDCTDIDECQVEGTCSANATCTNTPGSYNCTCNEGYELKGDVCVDIDECNTTSGNGCDTHKAKCINTSGSYNCECLAGFAGDGLTCTNRDECAEATHDCPTNAHCIDTEGSFDCKCNAGYEALGETEKGDPAACVDKDECATGDPCPANSTCSNTPGAFACTCNAGFRPVGEEGAGKSSSLPTACEAVDYCTEQQPCSPNGNCENVGDAPVCTCNTGYDGDGKTCTDIDECALGTHACASHGMCTNTQGSFQCVCIQGYSGDGRTCEDIDECATGEAKCDINAVCQNAPGTYKCNCKTGYMGGGQTCVPTQLEPGQQKCLDWSPWSKCENGRAHRFCISLPSKKEGISCLHPAGPAPAPEGGGGETTEIPLPEIGGAGAGEAEAELEQRCGPWLDWSACPGEANNMTFKKRERADTDESCKDQIQMIECPDPDLEAACGPWDPYSPCGVPVEGVQVAVRKNCLQAKMYAVCASTAVPPPSGDGRCRAWTPWSQCKTTESHSEGGATALHIQTQTRRCLHSELQEVRFCTKEEEGGAAVPPPECGSLGEWSPCEGSKQTRHFEGCPQTMETRQCATKECPAFGPWTVCGAVKPGERLRVRENCEEGRECDCLESETCTLHEEAVPPQEEVVPPQGEVVPPQGEVVPPQGEVVPPTGAVPPEEVTPPEAGGTHPPVTEEAGKEEKEEEGGVPTAAIAGGVVGGVLLLAAAGGGAAYGLKARGGPRGEAEQVDFEGEVGEAGAEAEPESETVIEIEDDAWADMD